LETYYEAAQAGQTPQPAWQQRLITLGRKVSASRPGEEPLVGEAVAVDEWGQLLLQTGDGRVHAIAAADVSLR
ncbi:MAG: biotin--[acetyl-CoA-carboxylase] ligase, partial [Chloroflexi bacterium]|nr:biotin--[acetyl-CoA-carboxylase] ligase [Chloroflexota bacterium]